MDAPTIDRDDGTGEPRRPAADSGLARLLAAEEELDAAMAEARRRAAKRLRSARAEARTLRREAESRLEDEVAELRERLRREHLQRVEEIHERAQRRATRFREAPADEVDSLARAVVRRLVEDGP